MNQESCDVLVIGAGPAGSTAAKYASQEGADVVMVEKRQEIGTPVRCGEGVAKRWLDDMGLQPVDRWIAHEVDGARIFSPDGSYIEVDEKMAGNECGYVINRDIFDRELAGDAAEAGTRIMVKATARRLLLADGKVIGARLEHMGRTTEVRAKVVIGADGFESQVGRWAGINTSLQLRDIDSCFQYTLVGVEGDSRFNHFHFGSYAPGGYVWVFWKGDDTANVGIGVLASMVKEKGMAKKLLDKFIEKRSFLSKGKVVRQISGAVSVCAPIDRTIADGLMLVGDAARLVDPVTGGGIYNGCTSGKLAGEIAAQAVQEGDTSAEYLRKYERAWRNRLEEHLYRNWMIKEKLTTIKDDVFNKAINAISDYDLEKLSITGILQAVRSRYPELKKEIERFMDF